MCGIAGTVSFDNSNYKVNAEYIENMNQTMSHRGPDGSGVWISGDSRVGFGHRRLSIIDLSEKANQPMINDDKTVAIIFNGEIYNHQEIRNELESTNRYIWNTDHSDTEVILHAFEEWGIECLNKFRGMFAIAIWDDKAKNLWLIRDRVGIKPLYYSIHDGRVVFASEIKALLEDPDQKREINEEAVFDYLSYLTTPAPHTLFDGIYKIPGGTWLCFDMKGNVKEHRYWDVLDNIKDLSKMTEEDISSNLLSQLREAVHLRKVSDVPVGVFLSGGIDSSTNAALFSEGENKKVKSFSIGYEGEYQSYKNELNYAKLAAKHTEAQYHEKLLSIEDLINFLPDMVKHQDEPIADPVCVPLYYVSKLAKDNNVTVCQVGEGADELFWGYPHWKKVLRIQNFADRFIPNIVLRFSVYLLQTLKLNYGWRYEALRRLSLNQPIYWGPEPYTHTEKMRILSPRMREKYKDQTSWKSIKPIYDNFLNKSQSQDKLDWMTYIDLNLRLPELLLMRVDKMSMIVSLEARVPFLDHKFVEFSMSIPSEIKTKNGQLKYILKKAVRGLIPDKIIDREKQGFAAPISEWSQESLGELGKIKVKEFCDNTDILDWDHVKGYLDDNKGIEWWPLLNLGIWWSIYIKQDDAEDLYQ